MLSSKNVCVNNAPYFGYQLSDGGMSYGITQGCCNSWTCPRCGEMRAKKEYGRIVEGCRTLNKDHHLWFITLTCRGRELSVKDADENYLKWTNRLLSTLRANAKKTNQEWCYVQVTERQERGHPHSHVLTTYCPDDLYIGTVPKFRTLPSGKKQKDDVVSLRSDYLEEKCVSAGLGNQYDITLSHDVEGTARYVAKYMFKDSMFSTTWAKNWRRVRYSRSFPKLPEVKTDALVLMKKEDWQEFGDKAVFVKTADEQSFQECQYWLVSHGWEGFLKPPPDGKIDESED